MTRRELPRHGNLLSVRGQCPHRSQKENLPDCRCPTAAGWAWPFPRTGCAPCAEINANSWLGAKSTANWPCRRPSSEQSTHNVRFRRYLQRQVSENPTFQDQSAPSTSNLAIALVAKQSRAMLETAELWRVADSLFRMKHRNQISSCRLCGRNQARQKCDGRHQEPGCGKRNGVVPGDAHQHA